MTRTLTLAAALAAALIVPAMAQEVKGPAPAATTAAPAPQDAGLVLTAQEATKWVGKPVMSSDGKNLGKVASFEHGADNKVTEMHADIGGFLGLGEHHVRLMPAQIKLQNDRVLLNLTSAQAKELPKIPR